MRRIAATLLLAISSVSFADEPSVALGYQFLPLLPAGFSLSTFGAFGQFGVEGSLNAGGQSSNQVETVRFSVSLGSNLRTPIGLYPSLAISAENVRRTHGDDLIENRTVWGLDVKISYIVSWTGITIGYRAPFREPLKGSAILGVSIVLVPY